MDFDSILKESVPEFDHAAYEKQWDNSDLQTPVTSASKRVPEQIPMHPIVPTSLKRHTRRY